MGWKERRSRLCMWILRLCEYFQYMVYLPANLAILIINDAVVRMRRFTMFAFKKISMAPCMRKWFYGILTLFIMGVIFIFSAQPGEESCEVSNSVADLFVRIGFYWNIRKCAHVFLYFCLGVSGSLLFSECLSAQNRWRPINTAMCSAAFCFLYSCLDEWHQTFVDGRAGKLADVGVDAIGFVAGILVILIVKFFIDTPPGKAYDGKR